jgi:hypothetical protein
VVAEAEEAAAEEAEEEENSYLHGRIAAECLHELVVGFRAVRTALLIEV